MAGFARSEVRSVVGCRSTSPTAASGVAARISSPSSRISSTSEISSRGSSTCVVKVFRIRESARSPKSSCAAISPGIRRVFRRWAKTLLEIPTSVSATPLPVGATASKVGT